MSYQLHIERSAQKALSKIERDDQLRLIETIRLLEQDPRPAGAKKLSGRAAWRIRAGAYRVIYEIHDDRLLVLVIQVDHRREVYHR